MRTTSSAAPKRSFWRRNVKRFEILRISLVLVAAALVWFHIGELRPGFNVIGLSGILFGGWPIFERAFDHLGQRRTIVQLCLTIVVLTVSAIGEIFTALIITAFLLAAEILMT